MADKDCLRAYKVGVNNGKWEADILYRHNSYGRYGEALSKALSRASRDVMLGSNMFETDAEAKAYRDGFSFALGQEIKGFKR